MTVMEIFFDRGFCDVTKNFFTCAERHCFMSNFVILDQRELPYRIDTLLKSQSLRHYTYNDRVDLNGGFFKDKLDRRHIYFVFDKFQLDIYAFLR